MSLSTKVLDDARLLAPDDPLVRSLDAYSAAIQGNWMPSGALTLRVADDGLRAWAFQPGTQRLAQIDLGTLAPTSLFIEQPISQVFDVASSGGDTRTLVALHAAGVGGVTLLDAREPDTARTRFYPGLLIGDER